MEENYNNNNNHQRKLLADTALKFIMHKVYKTYSCYPLNTLLNTVENSLVSVTSDKCQQKVLQ